MVIEATDKPDRDDPDGPDDLLQFFGHGPLIAMYRESAAGLASTSSYISKVPNAYLCIFVNMKLRKIQVRGSSQRSNSD